MHAKKLEEKLEVMEQQKLNISRNSEQDVQDKEVPLKSENASIV